jgi:hypothetical protein
VSAETATLIAGGLAILGTLLGLVIERLMRLVGRLRCEASGWEPVFITGDMEFGGLGIEEFLNTEQVDAISKVRYRFAIDLFNGKEVPTGLRGTRIELVHDDGKRFKSIPEDLGTARVGTLYPGIPTPVGAGIDSLEVVNLPPRQFVRKELQGSFGREAAVMLASGKWSRVEFVGELPARPFFGLLGSKTFRCVVAERG